MRRAQLHIQLPIAWLGICRAIQSGFSIHRDLLAYPQFEVAFSESYISETDAQALLESSDSLEPKYDADLNHLTSNIRAATPGEVDNNEAHGNDHDFDTHHSVAETYEIVKLAPDDRYLCAIPVIEPQPVLNETATELAKAEEARELARASAHGWDLVNGLDGTCLYYMSGWWSYSFCYNQDIVQYHALPASVKTGPPLRDPHTAEYVLGRVQDHHSAPPSTRRGHGQSHHESDESAGSAPPNTELQIKGDQRYLVQRMEGGTLCDLTGRERTIEVQYHCSPGSTQDRIGWIKEVTTCAYLMVVHTPRLCADVAFQPPKEARANIISCRTIVPESREAEWHARKTVEAHSAMVGQPKGAAKPPISIGGIIVGGKRLLDRGEGKEPHRLAPPRGFNAGNNGNRNGDSEGRADAHVEIVAQGKSKEEGSKIDILTPEELEELGLSPEMIQELQEELLKLAGDKGWKLEIVEVEGEPTEIQGIIEDEEDEDTDGEEGSREQFFREEL
jgi:protein OS-9